ncbi:hypothetical protein GP486_006181 [Trichoglossum hirsutum]|uniref:Mitochondrial fission process protein 1 n=1 Tax=Trichoglossum hirsutum TaxID=265104 RepID=A0A9P8L7J1_9PEZI|nr:hypothetical protein GP486_006181 [Trichoglossum hirsutum]
MAKKDKDKNPADGIPHIRPEKRPDFSVPPPREKLPDELQRIVDDDDTLLERIYDGSAQDTTDTPLRYAAYGSRIRTLLHSAHRYIAYTSDISESFRPVAHPYLVRGGYAVSWLYLFGDVSHEGYKAYVRNHATLKAADKDAKAVTIPFKDDYRTVIAQRAVFQSIASMGLPALTVHSIVRYSGLAFRHAKNTRIRTYGPIGVCISPSFPHLQANNTQLGLAAVPFLPYIFDKPVEDAVEWGVEKIADVVGKGREKEKEH